MQLQIEQAVEEYKRQKYVLKDEHIADFYLSFVRTHAQKLFENYDLPWDSKAEFLLQGCCVYYSRYNTVPFLTYFLGVMQNNYDLGIGKRSEQNFYEAQMFHGNGFHTFANTLTSNPERLSVERAQADFNRKHREELQAARIAQQEDLAREKTEKM